MTPNGPSRCPGGQWFRESTDDHSEAEKEIRSNRQRRLGGKPMSVDCVDPDRDRRRSLLARWGRGARSNERELIELKAMPVEARRQTPRLDPWWTRGAMCSDRQSRVEKATRIRRGKTGFIYLQRAVRTAKAADTPSIYRGERRRTCKRNLV